MTRAHHCCEHTFTGELTYEPSNYERAVLTFSRAHSTTQAFDETAEIVSHDQKSEPMNSQMNQRHIKRTYLQSRTKV